MGLITRGAKAAGGTAFVTGTTILASEVNTDLDTLYALANGAIDNANLAAGAAIAYSKLALTNSIVAGDLTTGCVTSGKILDGTIVNADVNAAAAIAMSKLGTGIASFSYDDLDTSSSSSTVLTTLATVSGVSVTTGNVVAAIASFGISIEYSAGAGDQVTFSLWRDATLVLTTTCDVFAASSPYIATLVGLDSPTTATVAYTFKVQSNGTNILLVTPNANAGRLYALVLR